jgi:hypothetical protein
MWRVDAVGGRAAQRDEPSYQPERLTVTLISDLAPVVQGRTWTEMEYATRDTRLAALGVQTLKRARRLGEGQTHGKDID